MTNRDYTDPQYKEWRKKIRSRDNNRCMFPDCKSKKQIEVHHILRWEDYPGLRYNLKNGICLCRSHHRLITGKEEHYAKLLGAIVANASG